MSFSSGFRAIRPHLASSINTSFNRRNASTAAVRAFPEAMASIAPHLKKQGAVDCRFACFDMMKSFHGVGNYDSRSFYDRLKYLLRTPSTPGKLNAYAEYEIVQKSHGIPQSVQEWRAVLEKHGPVMIQMQGITATSERGFSNEDGSPATSRFLEESFHCVLVIDMVMVGGRPCFLLADPEGGGTKINYIEACLDQGISKDADPSEVPAELLPSLNSVKELVNVQPVDDLIRNATTSDSTHGLYVAGKTETK